MRENSKVCTTLLILFLQLSFVNGAKEGAKEKFAKAMAERAKALKITDVGRRKEAFKNVIKIFLSIADQFPKTDEAVHSLYQAYHLYSWGLGMHKEATKILERLTTNYPKKAPYEAWLKLATSYWQMYRKDRNMLEKSIQIYKMLIAKYPEKAGELWKNIAKPYNYLGKKDEAISAYQKAIEFYKTKPESENQIVTILLELANLYRWSDFEEHILCYQRAIHEYARADRDLIAQCYLRMAQSYSAVWDTQIAIKYFEKLVREFKDVRNKRILIEALLLWGDTYKKMPLKDRFERAIEKYYEAKRFSEKNKVGGEEEILFRIAETYFQNLKDVKKAEEIYRQIVEIYPSARNDIIQRSRDRLNQIKGERQ